MKIKEGFLVRKVAEDFVAVPVNNIENNFYGMVQLNKTGAFIFEMLQVEHTKEEVIAAMQDKYDLSAEQANLDFDDFIEILTDNDLLI